MKYFGYDVTPYAPYSIDSGFIFIPRPVLKQMSVKDLRKRAIVLSEVQIETRAQEDLPDHQISLLDSMDENSFTSRDPSDCLDGCSKFFRENYRQIMLGENPDWILYSVSLWYDCIKFQYCDCTAISNISDWAYKGTIHIRQGNLPKDIRFIAKVPSIDGDEIESYDVRFLWDDWRLDDSSYGSRFIIQESAEDDTKKGRRLRFFRTPKQYVCRIDE